MILPDEQKLLDEVEDNIGRKISIEEIWGQETWENMEHKIGQEFKNSMKTINNTKGYEECKKTFSFLSGGGYN